MQVDCAYYLEAVERINNITPETKIRERLKFEKYARVDHSNLLLRPASNGVPT